MSRDTELPFDNLLQEFDPDQNPSRIVEGLETQHRLHAEFDAAVVLLHYVTQVGTTTNLHRIFPTVVEFIVHTHSAQRGMACSKPSSVMVRGCPCRLRALRKKALAAAMSRVRLRCDSTVRPTASTARYRYIH